MAFLTFGGRDWDVVSVSGAPTPTGGRVARMFNDTLRSSVRRIVEPLTFILYEMPQADYDALLAAAGNGAPIAVGGDVMGGVVDASVRVTGTEYVRDGVGYLIRPTVEITPE